MPSFEDLISLVAKGGDLNEFSFNTTNTNSKLSEAINDWRSSERYKSHSNLPTLQEEPESVPDNGIPSSMQQNPLDISINPRDFLNQFLDSDNEAAMQELANLHGYMNQENSNINT